MARGCKSSPQSFFLNDDSSWEGGEDYSYSMKAAGDTTWGENSFLPCRNIHELPVQKGWLLKRSRHLLRGWLQRYFVLENKALCYFRRVGESFPKGVFNFDQLTVRVEVTCQTKFEVTITPLRGQRVLRLRCVDEDDLWNWCFALHCHVTASQGWTRDLTVVSMRRHFWRRSRISARDFSEVQATTGDLLLFRGRSTAARLQRLFTRSQYDHVALLLRYSNGKLMLLEATASEGVALVPWDEFVGFRWNLMYSRLAYRRLEYAKKEEMLDALSEFIRDVMGKKYRITVSKLLKCAKNRTPGTEEGFFCSELVAAALKKLDLLPAEVPAANYLPGAFARAGTARLLRGAEYSDEFVIDFSL